MVANEKKEDVQHVTIQVTSVAGVFTEWGSQKVKVLCSFCITSIHSAWHIGIASSSHFVASSVSGGGIVCHRHTLYSGQYLKNCLSDLIQIWHVNVTAPQGVLYSLLTLNSH